MGLFNALFGDQRAKVMARMKNVAYMAKTAVWLKVLTDMQDDTRSVDEKKTLAAAVANTIFSESSPDPQMRKFAEKNASYISDAIAGLKPDEETKLVITQAVRVLAVTRFDPAHPEQARRYLDTIDKLGLLVPGGEEPSPDNFPALVRTYCQKHMSADNFQQIEHYFHD
jgi:hypothetical protein